MPFKGNDIIKRCEKLFNTDERNHVDSNWQLLAEFLLNNQAGGFKEDSTPGIRRMSRVFDSTPIQSNQDLAASMHSVVTNPAVRWSKLRFKEDFLNDDEDAMKWIEMANKTLHEYLNESNFNNEVAKNYQMFTALGNMCLLSEMKLDSSGQFEGFKFRSIHLSEIAWSENMDGIVDTVYRKFRLTARQAVEKFGDKVSNKIKEAADLDPERRFEFIHYAGPRDPKEIKLNEQGLAPGKHRPIASIYVEKTADNNLEDANIVLEDGYYEFPFHVTRWETRPSEVYGFGPGHTALPDVRTLNRVRELMLESAALAVRPTMLTTQRNVLGSFKLAPGHLNVVRSVQDIVPFESGARFDVAQFELELLRNSIKSTFYLDKLLLPPRPEVKTEMTAFEIAQRLEQMQKVLGPTLGRLNKEYLEPTVLRCLKMLLRAGILPQMPQVLLESGVDLEIVFVNALARSQVVEDLRAMQEWVQEAAFLGQYDPSAFDNVNIDGLLEHSAKVRNVPEIARTDDKTKQQKREARAQQQQAAQALEAGVAVADIASKTGGGGQ